MHRLRDLAAHEVGELGYGQGGFFNRRVDGQWLDIALLCLCHADEQHPNQSAYASHKAWMAALRRLSGCIHWAGGSHCGIVSAPSSANDSDNRAYLTRTTTR